MRRLALAALLVASAAACSTPGPPAAVHEVAVATPAAPAVPVRTLVPSPTPQPSPTSRPSPLVFGGDISWPSCPLGTPGALPKKQPKGLPLPGPHAQFVLLGLTNGPGFYPNPCLAWEVEEARSRHLLTAAYAFTTLPKPTQVQRYGGRGPYSSSTALGRLRNAAWAEAQVNLASLRRTRLRTPIIWMDIEPQDYLSPWGSDVAANRAAIRAVRQAYRDAGYRTGFYSSDTPWKRITGGLEDAGPTWVTVGPRGRTAALAKCAARSFSGGPSVLAQWWDGPKEDLDLPCPGASATVASLFAPP